MRVFPFPRDLRNYLFTFLNVADKRTFSLALGIYHKNDDNLCNECAEHGYLELLRWAIYNKYIYDRDALFTIIKWLYSNMNIVLWSSTVQLAVDHNHLNIVKWLKHVKCPFPSFVFLLSNTSTEIEDWLRENNCEIVRIRVSGTFVVDN